MWSMLLPMKKGDRIFATAIPRGLAETYIENHEQYEEVAEKETQIIGNFTSTQIEVCHIFKLFRASSLCLSVSFSIFVSCMRMYKSYCLFLLPVFIFFIILCLCSA